MPLLSFRRRMLAAERRSRKAEVKSRDAIVTVHTERERDTLTLRDRERERLEKRPRKETTGFCRCCFACWSRSSGSGGFYCLKSSCSVPAVVVLAQNVTQSTLNDSKSALRMYDSIVVLKPIMYAPYHRRTRPKLHGDVVVTRTKPATQNGGRNGMQNRTMGPNSCSPPPTHKQHQCAKRKEFGTHGTAQRENGG